MDEGLVDRWMDQWMPGRLRDGGEVEGDEWMNGWPGRWSDRWKDDKGMDKLGDGWIERRQMIGGLDVHRMNGWMGDNGGMRDGCMDS